MLEWLHSIVFCVSTQVPWTTNQIPAAEDSEMEEAEDCHFHLSWTQYR